MSTAFFLRILHLEDARRATPAVTFLSVFVIYETACNASILDVRFLCATSHASTTGDPKEKDNEYRNSGYA